MAEPDFVSYDKYRADLADFRSDMARFREEVRESLTDTNVKLAQMETRLTRWMLVAAGFGGFVGGMVAAVVRLIG